MKKFVLLVLSCFLLIRSNAVAQTDPIILTIDGDSITRSEFDRVYRKNNNRSDIGDPAAVNEYMQLFINYKLKVKEAEAQKLDTAESFINELNGYRKQLAQPYLTDKDVSEELVKEAYERMKTEVRASQILIKVSSDALPRDTAEAYARIMIIRDHLLGKTISSGRLSEYENLVRKVFKTDSLMNERISSLKNLLKLKSSINSSSFEEMAKLASEDPSAADNSGDLGYFTSLMMVYPFESAAYKLKPGEISMPVRTKFGYHIIRCTDIRPASGEIHVAHIMVKVAPNAPDSVQQQAKLKIDEIYNKLKAGEKFEDLAMQYSDDRGSSQNGGVLPWFGTGRMVAEFEKEAFSLAKDGDYSAPVRTSYGWHIIKRLEKRALASFDDKKNEIKNQVQRDSRSEMSKSSMIERIKKEYNFKEFVKSKDELINALDTSVIHGDFKAESLSRLNKPVFSLGKKVYSQHDFAYFIESRQTKRTGSASTPQAIGYSMYDDYVNNMCLAYEESQLENKYPEFRILMNEYRDGILLFDLTDRMVWSKAVKDSAGLLEFYKANKSNYMWGDRCKAIIYTCQNKAIAGKVKKMIKKGVGPDKIAADINEKSKLNVSINEGTFSKGDNEIIDGINWEKGIVSDINKGNQVIVIDILDVLKPMPKSLDEAKGLITSDYQNYLEQEWIDSLRSKYKVQINEAVLKTIGK
ncbi:MAG: peptidylprolyl isomerase [Bacteroidia bacterium]|nr:peptidylprolyl isomerase [Bacteroidia bacterium]MCZ2277087.1 peptidylprolyl isomerase [Bacteroidia bacterium]